MHSLSFCYPFHFHFSVYHSFKSTSFISIFPNTSNKNHQRNPSIHPVLPSCLRFLDPAKALINARGILMGWLFRTSEIQHIVRTTFPLYVKKSQGVLVIGRDFLISLGAVEEFTEGHLGNGQITLGRRQGMSKDQR